MAIEIRPAYPSEQWVIRRIVWRAGINPTQLDWRRFLVAAEDERIIGVGQVKPHPAGQRELASIAVIPERQGRGIGTQLIHALLARESAPVHLVCAPRLEIFYKRLGFRRLNANELPKDFRSMALPVRLNLLCVMKYEPQYTDATLREDESKPKEDRGVMINAHHSGRRLLIVFAHPDDETFGIGGTIAKYARAGVIVHLICATKGECGEAPPDLRGYDSKAEMRMAELHCAAKILGLASVHYLGYRDSGMTGSPDNQHPKALAVAPIHEVAERIAAHIRLVRPQVIITFDPIGGYRHPDHIAIHQATVAAFRLVCEDVAVPTTPVESASEVATAYAPQKLYYATFSRRWLKLMVRLMPLMGMNPRRFGKNKDIDFTTLTTVDFPIHTTIATYDVNTIKMQAFACHASQGGGGVPWYLRGMAHWFLGNETYMRAIPAAAPPQREYDLFEGVL